MDDEFDLGDLVVWHRELPERLREGGKTWKVVRLVSDGATGSWLGIQCDGQEERVRPWMIERA